MSERLNEYLVGEAREYLGQLRSAIEGGRPDADDLVRLARGVRGSVRMAGAHALARIAERLEETGRALAAGTAAWTEELAHRVARTIEDLEELLSPQERDPDATEGRLRAALDRWSIADDSGAGAPAPVVPGSAPERDGDTVPISELYYDDAGPHLIAAADTTGDDDEVVPVESLLLRGPRALEAALALRSGVERQLAQPSDDAGALIAELFDLIRLGRENVAE